MKVTTLRIDLAKSIFQLHGVTAARQSRPTETRDAEQAPGNGRAATSLCHWDGSVRECTRLGAGVAAAGAHGEVD